MRLALLLPDGVGIRNFLLGGFAEAASQRGRLDILHVVPNGLLPEFRDGLGPEVHWHALEPSGEGRLESTLRSSLAYAHMYWARTEAMRRRLGRPVSSPTWGRWAVVRTARAVGRIAATPAGIASLERLHQRVAGREPAVGRYRKLFEAVGPDILFCSHQRPPEIVAPVLAARALGIPTATFIFSWDNLTSKGRIAAPFDHYLVWSEHMAEELIRYYPDVPRACVHVVGTPQFDPYRDERLRLSRAEFLARIGADPARPLICYSGGDVGGCPDDALHVRLLMQLIRSGRIAGRPQVVLRPSPVDPGERYAGVRAEFPELHFAQPAWVHSKERAWAGVIPHRSDVGFLANLTYHSDLNINVASTMTLDFAIHDRPVVNVAFDVSNPPPLGLPLDQVYYQYEHYRPVSELGAARIARSPDELAQHVNDYLADPALDRDNRRRLVELEVSQPLGNSAERIIATLDRVAAAETRRPSQR